MEVLQLAVPLLGVVLGALLSGAGTLFRSRSARRAAIGQALADLLEVRVHIVAVETCLSEMRSRCSDAAETAVLVRQLVDGLSPIDGNLSSRYDRAIQQLSAHDPLLAFQLRSKADLPNHMSSVRDLSRAGGLSSEQVDEFLKQFVLIALPALDAAVRQLARAHSWRTSMAVKRYLVVPTEVPQELVGLFQFLPAAKDPPT